MPRNEDDLEAELDNTVEDDFDPELVEIVEREFSAEDQEALLINEHERFQKSSGKVGHALVYTTNKGMFAKQFTPPSDETFHDTQIRPVGNIRLEKATFGSLSEEYLRAETPNGTEMVGKRRVEVTTTSADGVEQKHDLWRLSPVASHMWKDQLWVGACEDKLPMFSSKLSKEKRAELDAELAASEVITKEITWELEKESVLERERHKKDPRNPDQNTVMGHSAFEEMESYREQYADELHEDRKAILGKNKDAKKDYRGGSIKSQHRGEWNHAMGHGLTSLSIDPQTRGNLAAAPKYINSEMMCLERPAKWAALHRPEAKITGHTRFVLCPNSEILDYGDLSFTYEENGQTVKFEKKLNPWRKYANFPKPSDIAQNTLVTSKLLLNIEADSIQTVAGGKGVKAMSTKSGSTTTTTSSVPRAPSAVVTATNTPIAGKTAHELKAAQIEKLKSSVVRVLTRGFEFDYGKPWRAPTFSDWSGSGVVVKENGQLYILTNAHVVENQASVMVRLANDNDEYEAEVIQVGYQCDMAIMRVTDPVFLKKCKPLPIGEMLNVGQEVQVLGFPMGGEEMSYTTGPTSRVLFDSYCESGEFNLQVQTQAPINPGNSGGPVISDGKVVGLAFQSLILADGLNYVIPVPVMRHFMRDALSSTGYKGFPDLGMDLQELTNPAVRRYYGLKDEQTGIRVKKVDPLEDAAKHIKTDDIIIAVDGIEVSNDAKVNVPNIGDRLDLNYLWLRKFMGETVVVDLLRRESLGEPLKHLKVKVKLQYRTGETKKVGALEFDKSPSFYINSGVIFQALTPNFLESMEGLKFREIREDDDALVKDIACKNPGDKVVIINCVLKYSGTAGFHDVCNEEVKTINGIEINNMQDVARALSNNKAADHAIILKDKQLIVVPNMRPDQHMALLKKYSITQQCSEDLKPENIKAAPLLIPAPTPAQKPKTGQKAAPAPVTVSRSLAKSGRIIKVDPIPLAAPDEDGDASESCHTDDKGENSLAGEDEFEMDDFIAPEDGEENEQEEELAATTDGEQEQDEAEQEVQPDYKDPQGKMGFTGRLTFMNSVKAIEQRAKDRKRRLVQSDDEDELDDKAIDVAEEEVVAAPPLARLPHKKFKPGN
jgi:S1-C subfamily serine protease